MADVHPRVYLIAFTKLDNTEIGRWMDSIGVGANAVLSRDLGVDAEALIELSARRCYKSFAPGLNPNVKKVRTDSAEYHKNILESGHGSVLEHATATWAIEGVSRVFTHELVRNRAGNAFSQESLRYMRLSEGIDYWLPPEIASDERAARLFHNAMERMAGWQRELAEMFAIDEAASFGRKKKLTSAFRRIAPLGLATGIVLTTNMRSLRWLIEQRTSRHAEYEIRLVFNMIAGIAKARWPMLFQDFRVVDTGDGDDVKEWVPANRKV